LQSERDSSGGNKLMSSTELHPETDRTEHAPIWAVALAGTMLAASFSRRGADKEPATPDNETRYLDRETTRRDDSVPDDERRGRAADTPSEIPAKGWKDILLRVYYGISEDRILLVAAGVTFYLLLSIFPGIAALFSIYGLFANPADIAGHLEALANVAPGGAMDILREEMTRLASKGGTALGVGFIVSLGVSLWTTKSGVSAVFDALNIVYGEKEKRGTFKFYLVTLTFTLASIVFILLAIAVVVLLPVVLNFIPLPGGTDLLVNIARWPILFVLTAFALAVLYRFGPSRTQPRWRWVTWGSAVATVLWIAASVLFSWYVANFGSYDKTYGSLGAIIGFMTWIWISIIVVLLGAKLDAEMEHQTARETTAGQPKPLGMRGARMADTVGAAQG
jgi:membrane protein